MMSLLSNPCSYFILSLPGGCGWLNAYTMGPECFQSLKAKQSQAQPRNEIFWIITLFTQTTYQKRYNVVTIIKPMWSKQKKILHKLAIWTTWYFILSLPTGCGWLNVYTMGPQWLQTLYAKQSQGIKFSGNYHIVYTDHLSEKHAERAQV